MQMDTYRLLKDIPKVKNHVPYLYFKKYQKLFWKQDQIIISDGGNSKSLIENYGRLKMLVKDICKIWNLEIAKNASSNNNKSAVYSYVIITLCLINSTQIK